MCARVCVCVCIAISTFAEDRFKKSEQDWKPQHIDEQENTRTLAIVYLLLLPHVARSYIQSYAEAKQICNQNNNETVKTVKTAKNSENSGKTVKSSQKRQQRSPHVWSTAQ